MSKWKPWLLLAVIFVVGMVTGSALTMWLGPHFMHPPGARDMKSHWMMQLTRQLNLTADQQAKIDPIVTEADHQIQSMRRDEAGNISQIMEKTNQQIAAILTPGQQAELQKMEKEMDQNRDMMFPGRKRPWGQSHGGPGGMMPPPPPPPPPDGSTNAAPVPKP